jgi:protein required for attachment to host cells
MNTVWILVLDRVKARVFKRVGKSKKVEFIHSWDHPEGRMKNGELLSDDYGVDMNRTIEYASNPQSGTSMKEVLVQRFCSKVGSYLDNERKRGVFDELVLVAEPKMLGIMKGVLSQKLAKLVKGSVQKDFCRVENKKIPDVLLANI